MVIIVMNAIKVYHPKGMQIILINKKVISNNPFRDCNGVKDASNSTWYLEIGYSNHVIGNQSLFLQR